MTAANNTRISPEVERALSSYCNDFGVSKNYVTEKAIKNYLIEKGYFQEEEIKNYER
jgi:predicted transcriptional regulator